MNFLAPLFLLGAVLVGAPILAHLIRRATRERIGFSATRFLAPSAPRLTRRSRISHPWLLALRTLIVLLLAAGFARPWLKSPAAALPAPTRAPQHIAVVLDASASMQRSGLWAAAVARVRTVADELEPADQLVLLSTAGGATTLLPAVRWQQTPPEQRADQLARLLAGLAPGWEGTPLDTTLDAAVDALAELAENTPGAASRVVVVSDFTAGTRLSGLAAREWPRGVSVELAALAPATSSAPNAGLTWLGWAPQADGTRAARVRVSLHGATAPLPVSLQLATAAGTALGAPLATTLTVDEARSLLLPLPAGAGDTVRLTLTGDTEPFDNTLWLIPPQARTLGVHYLGPHAATDPAHARFYLTRATEGWRDPVINVTAGDAPFRRATATASEPAASPAAPVLHVVTAPLDASGVDALRAQLEGGAFALVLVRDTSLIATAAALAGEPGWTPLAVSGGASGALLGAIDFAHPLFAPFADPRFSDFTRVRFWRAQSLELPTSSAAVVVARFDDGVPAVLEVPVGRGGLVVWGGDWSAAASQWVLSSKFVPWLQALLERAGGGPARPAIAELGDAARLAITAEARWSPVAAAATEAPADPANTPASPGLYRLTDGAGSRVVALNVPASETDTAPLPLDRWEQLGVPLIGGTAAARVAPVATVPDAPPATAVRLEQEQQLWRWLLLAVAVLLAVESLLAATTAARAPGFAGDPTLPTPSPSSVATP